MNYTLGFTIGTASIGWAAVTDSAILATGTRIFPTGTDGDIESGRDLSRNKARQMARQRRRQLRRKKQRLREIRRVLIRIGLATEHDDLAYRSVKGEAAPENPYALRTRALDERIEPHALARILYHMAHRRGFQSGRRTEREDDEEIGVVLAGIKSLEEAIRASGSRTLGEHLFKLDPVIARRRRWTSRQMYRTEVQLIFQTQARFHPTLTEEVQREINRLLFFQRPLKSQAFRVGPCELEPSRRRLALAHPLAQEFRLLQKVNDLRIVDDVGVDAIKVTPAMREQLTGYLMKNPYVTFPGLRKIYKLPKTARFNFERAEEKNLTGHRTAAKLSVPDELLAATAEAMLEISEDNGLKNRLGRLGHDSKTIDRLLDSKLEGGYLNLSRRAALRLLPAMRGGASYMTAVKDLYPAAVKPKAGARSTLPMVSDVHPYLSNPLASRGLCELRKLVNAIIRKYGKPSRIHMELHRHLQTGPKSRNASAKRMRARQTEREKAAEKLLKDLSIKDASWWQIEKILLANELGWVDPHTGKPINIRNLCGGDPTFHVMHILPFDMTLDDDFSNKTLAHVSFLEKRHPESLLSEMNLSADVDARYATMTEAYRDEKVRRLRLTREEAIAEYGEKFAERFVESSSHLATVAREYVSLLGVPVQVSRPRVTSYIREALGLSYVFREMKGDHRAHAFNALAVALTTPTMIRRLCAAAKKGERRRRFPGIEPPWSDFTESATQAVHAITPSPRVKRRVRGSLHSENPLSKPYVDAKGKTFHLSKRPLAAITEADMKKIFSPVIRDVVVRQFERLKAQNPTKYKDPKKAFGDPQNLPIHCGYRVRRVDVVRTEHAFSIGSNGHTRYVTNKENHHALILGDDNKWTRKIVSQFEAQRRLVAGEPVIGHGLFTLSKGEVFEIDYDGKRILMRCRSANEDPRISAVRIYDARTLEEIGADLFRESVDQLRKRRFRKVHVNLLGEVKRDGS